MTWSFSFFQDLEHLRLFTLAYVHTTASLHEWKRFWIYFNFLNEVRGQKISFKQIVKSKFSLKRNAFQAISNRVEKTIFILKKVYTSTHIRDHNIINTHSLKSSELVSCWNFYATSIRQPYDWFWYFIFYIRKSLNFNDL